MVEQLEPTLMVLGSIPNIFTRINIFSIYYQVFIFVNNPCLTSSFLYAKKIPHFKHSGSSFSKLLYLFMNLLHICVIYFQLLTTLLIVFSRNPIHSILLLIILFFEMAFVLVLFNVEFISILLIVVYVGAIAVLFLFVVMMLQVKSEPFNSFYIILISFILSLFFYSENVYFLNKSTNFFTALHSSSSEFSSHFDSLKDIETLGQVLFNYYPVYVVIAGLLLLVALVGSIVLIIDVNKSVQSNVVFRRLSRTDNFVRFFF